MTKQQEESANRATGEEHGTAWTLLVLAIAHIALALVLFAVSFLVLQSRNPSFTPFESGFLSAAAAAAATGVCLYLTWRRFAR